MVRTIMNAAQAIIEEELAELSEIDLLGSLGAKSQFETIKMRVFSGLRAGGFEKAAVAALEAAYDG